MMKKGISVTYESIRYWCVKFGKLYSKRIKKMKRYGDYVYMDEVFCKINGKRVYLWRAVDQDGQTIDVLAQEKRNSEAASRFIKKTRKPLKQPTTKAVTDKLKSYIKPIKIILPNVPISLSNMRIIELKIHTNRQGLGKGIRVNLNH